MNLPNHFCVSCSFLHLLWIFRKEERECDCDESAEFCECCFLECYEKSASDEDDEADDCRFDVFEYSVNHNFFCIFETFGLLDSDTALKYRS